MPRPSYSAEPGFRHSSLVAAGLLLLLAGVPATSVLARGPESVADIAEGLQDAVVNISTNTTLSNSWVDSVYLAQGVMLNPSACRLHPASPVHHRRQR